MRSSSDRVIAGVAGGIAAYLAVDPVIVRLAFVALLFTGAGALIYPLLWLLMPAEGASGGAPSQALHEIRTGATRFGEDLREVFVAGGPARKRRFDPMTGEPVNPEAEIPINNVGPETGTPADAERRNRMLGIALIAIAVFILLNMLLGPAFGKFLLPLLLVAAGVIVLRRK
jgi:phage shock protein C